MSHGTCPPPPNRFPGAQVRLFPYLLNLLVDPDAAIRTHALCAVTALGDEYLEQHEAEYREKVEYGHAEEAKRDARLNIDLPHPFDGRPPFGARVRVRNHFRALIHPIIAELDCWTAKERVQSAALLEVLLIFVEDSATEFGHMILPAISKAAADSDDRELHRRVCRCAEVWPSSFTDHEGKELMAVDASTVPSSQKMASDFSSTGLPLFTFRTGICSSRRRPLVHATFNSDECARSAKHVVTAARLLQNSSQSAPRHVPGAP